MIYYDKLLNAWSKSTYATNWALSWIDIVQSFSDSSNLSVVH